MAMSADRDFVVAGPTSRVVFARGCVTSAGEENRRALAKVQALGCRRLLLIGSARALAAVGAFQAQLEAQGMVAGVVEDLGNQHVTQEVVQRVTAEAERSGADALVSVSGGSSIGVAKAVAVAKRLPTVCIPTTYSGSEVTAYFGVQEPDPSDATRSRKVSRRDEAARPRLVLYDPALLESLPRALTVASLFNALAHALEVLWLPRAAPQSRWAAREAVRVLLQALPAFRPESSPPAADVVDDSLYGAYLAAYALDAESLGLQHRLAHVLGGAYGLPHAEAHTAILPYVVHFHREALPTELRDVACRIYDLQHGLMTEPPALASLGFKEEDVDGAIDRLLSVGGIAEHPAAPLDRTRLEEMLRLAVQGQRPSTTGPTGFTTSRCYPAPRIPYLDDVAFRAQDPEAADRILARRKGQPLNLDRALMHAPAVAQAWNGLFGCLRSGLGIDGRLRELVILRVAALNRAYYEWYQHYDPFVAEGGTAAEAAALGAADAAGLSPLLFSARDRAVLAYVDAMTRRVQVPDAVAAAALEALGGSVKALVEVTALCGGYNLVSRFLEALHLTPEQTARLPPMPIVDQGGRLD